MIAGETLRAPLVVRAVEEPLADADRAPAAVAIPAHQRLDLEHVLDMGLVLAVPLHLVVHCQATRMAARSQRSTGRARRNAGTTWATCQYRQVGQA